MPSLAQSLRETIIDIPDFPSPGVVFKDLTPVFQSPPLFRAALDAFQEALTPLAFDHIVGIESRGFLIAAPLADRMGRSLALVRKLGKLPRETAEERYALEYGENTLELHRDALVAASSVILVDDLLATGGTLAAAGRLVTRLDAEVVAVAVMVELAYLNGRKRLDGLPVLSLLTYEHL